jgi:cytochrome c-type biogenesis protein CcmH/NrfG
MEVSMQTINQERFLNRAIIFLFLGVGLVVISWGMTRIHSLGLAPTLAKNYFTGAVDRTITASTDRLIESLQTGLRAAPDDWQAYSQLGVVHCQV